MEIRLYCPRCGYSGMADLLSDDLGECMGCGTALAKHPHQLHQSTTNLVNEFATALKEKLARAEEKYGYTDAWAYPHWIDECREQLRRHFEKGDPLDVAAYCAFLWHHEEPTSTPALVNCDSCSGSGTTGEHGCTDCLGTGQVPRSSVPALPTMAERLQDAAKFLRSEIGGNSPLRAMAEVADDLDAHAASLTAPKPKPPKCSLCRGEGTIDQTGYGEWRPCPECNPASEWYVYPRQPICAKPDLNPCDCRGVCKRAGLKDAGG
jgi:hypothetical protein